jgi:hypothetical protein
MTRAVTHWSYGSCGEPMETPHLTNGRECTSPSWLAAMRRLEAEGDAEFAAARVTIVDVRPVDVTPVGRDQRLADEAGVPLFGPLP